METVLLVGRGPCSLKLRILLELEEKDGAALILSGLRNFEESATVRTNIASQERKAALLRCQNKGVFLNGKPPPKGMRVAESVRSGPITNVTKVVRDEEMPMLLDTSRRVAVGGVLLNSFDKGFGWLTLAFADPQAMFPNERLFGSVLDKPSAYTLPGKSDDAKVVPIVTFDAFEVERLVDGDRGNGCRGA